MSDKAPKNYTFSGKISGSKFYWNIPLQ